MQQLILPHWARASQRCKCGHSSMEPLTSVGKVWNYRTASTFLSPKRTWNMHWFIYVFYFYRDKKHPQGCFFLFFFIILLVRAKEKNDQNHHREWQIYSEFLCWRFRRDHIWLAEVRGFLQSGQTAVVTPGRKRITNQILTVTLVYRCARGVTRRGRRQRFHSMFVGNVKNVWLENSAWQAIRWHTFFFFFFGDCAALLPPCQCMLLSTAITRGITVHFVNNGSTRFVFFWAFQHGRRWSTYSRTQIILNRQYKQWFDFFIYMNLPE